jgi:hypothetical protein
VINVKMLQEYLPENLTVVVLEVNEIKEVGLGSVAAQVIAGGTLGTCDTIHALRELADNLERDYGPCTRHTHE